MYFVCIVLHCNGNIILEKPLDFMHCVASRFGYPNYRLSERQSSETSNNRIDCITRSVKGEKGRSPAASVFPCLGVGDKLQSCVLILTTLTSLSVPALKHIAGNFALTFLPLLERFILLHPLYFRFDYLPLSFSPNLITGQRATGHAVFVSWKPQHLQTTEFLRPS